MCSGTGIFTYHLSINSLTVQKKPKEERGDESIVHTVTRFTLFLNKFFLRNDLANWHLKGFFADPAFMTPPFSSARPQVTNFQSIFLYCLKK
jgi:hypothetical protein